LLTPLLLLLVLLFVSLPDVVSEADEDDELGDCVASNAWHRNSHTTFFAASGFSPSFSLKRACWVAMVLAFSAAAYSASAFL